jgi:hypothetical protein
MDRDWGLGIGDCAVGGWSGGMRVSDKGLSELEGIQRITPGQSVVVQTFAASFHVYGGDRYVLKPRKLNWSAL